MEPLPRALPRDVPYHRRQAARLRQLTLQLRFMFEVGLLGGGLMSASPEGPCDDGGGLDLALRQAASYSSVFLH